MDEVERKGDDVSFQQDPEDCGHQFGSVVPTMHNYLGPVCKYAKQIISGV